MQKKALVINFKFYGQNHPILAGVYSSLGAIYQAQCNLGLAAKYIREAFAIDSSFVYKHLKIMPRKIGLGDRLKA
jgi:hypothetical protein